MMTKNIRWYFEVIFLGNALLWVIYVYQSKVAFILVIYFSSFRKEALCYKWIIKDAETVLIQAGKQLKSPAFKIPGVAVDFSFCVELSKLKFYTRCSSHTFRMSVSKIDSPDVKDVWVMDGCVSLLNPLSGVRDNYNLKNGKLISFVWEKQIDPDALKNLLHNKALTIQINCVIMILNSLTESVNIMPVSDFGRRMKLMYEKKLFTDIQIEVGEKTFDAHRAVLASFSDVFEKMFEINMKEKEEKRVVISDIDAEVMSNLLSFMYTGSAPNIRAHTKELLLAADKYNMQDLMGICENDLRESLTPANVAEVLLVANMMQSEASKTLRESCMLVIKQNMTSVYKSDSWKKLKESSLNLAVDIMEKVILAD